MDPSAQPQADAAPRDPRGLPLEACLACDLPEALMMNAERLRVALAAAPLVIFNQDRELRYTWLRNTTLGFKPAEVIGRTDEELVDAAAARFLTALKRRVLESGRGERQEVRASRGGQTGWYDLSVEPLRLASGEIAGITCVAVDISARKQAEEALRASEERYRTVVEDQTEVVSRFKADGTFTFVNEVFCRFFGKTREELLGRRWQPNAVAEDLLMIEAKLRTLSPAHPVVVIENRAYAADGGVHWMQFVNRAFFDATGLLIEMQSVGRDITERKRLEADRAAALARLAFVEEQERLRLSRELHDQTAQRLVALAVELKNLETDLTAGDTRAGKVRSLRRAVDDLQQQVRQIAWDLRAGELMEGGFERALREYVEEWSERAGVTVDCECQGLNDQQSPPLLEATLYRVAQEALANVQKHARARRVSVLLERVDALLRLTVEDDGCGFDLEKVENLPATERRLGLLGMKERVRLAGGSLVLETSPGAGTTVLVRLPIVAGAEL